VTLQAPLWLEQGIYTARNDRTSLIGGLLEKDGIADRNDLVVTPTSPASMKINVSGGTAFVAGNVVGQQGFYAVTNMGTDSITVPASNPQYARKDLLVLMVNDSQHNNPDGDAGDPEDSAFFKVIQGTAAATPLMPARPKMSIEVGRVTVRAGTSSIASSDIELTYRTRAILKRDMGASIIPVENISDRNVIASQLGINDNNPAFFFRADAPTGTELEVTTDGKTFRALINKPSYSERYPVVSLATGNPTQIIKTPQSLAYTDIPDPGFPYYVVADGAGYLGSLDNNSWWELQLILEKGAGKHIMSRFEPHIPGRMWQSVQQIIPASLAGRPLTGSCRVYMRALRYKGTGNAAFSANWHFRAGIVPA
jgi:hypothetical protein